MLAQLGDGQGEQALAAWVPLAWQVGRWGSCPQWHRFRPGQAPLSSQRPPRLPASPSGLAVLDIPLLERFLQVTAWALKGPGTRHVLPETVTH